MEHAFRKKIASLVIHESNKNGTSPSVFFFPPPLFLVIFLSLLFSFHSLPSKMDKRQEEYLDTPHRRLFIFRHCWISRSKPGETARALRFIILFFDALFLSHSSVSQSSLSYLPPPAVTRPPMRSRAVKPLFFRFAWFSRRTWAIVLSQWEQQARQTPGQPTDSLGEHLTKPPAIQ